MLILISSIGCIGCAKRVPVIVQTPPAPVPVEIPGPVPEIQPDHSFDFATGPCDPRLTALVVTLNAQNVSTPCVEQ